MKVIFWIIGLLLLMIIGVGTYVYLNSGALIKTAIETYGPDYLGADVGVSSVAVRPTEGTGNIRGLRIGNPPGFEGPDAMRIGSIDLVLDMGRISQELIIIKRLTVDGAELSAIVKGTNRTNFQALMDRVSQSAGSDDADSGAGPKLIIEQFDFVNAKTSVTSDILGDAALNLPDVHLEGIGQATNGATAAEAVRQLLQPITEAITRELVRRGLDVDQIKEDVRGRVEEGIRDRLGEGLKRFTDKLGN